MTDESAGNTPESRIEIERFYLKDVSFESPHTPDIFTGAEDWKPQMNLQLQTEASHVDNDRYEVSVRVTVTATAGEETMFLVELKQAGLFRLTGYDDKTRRHLLGTACPNMLFPFVRENLDSLVQRGGMPQLLLQPINFEALHAQQAAQQANPAPGNGSTEPGTPDESTGTG